MNRTLLSVILVALLFTSCTSEPGKQVPKTSETSETVKPPKPYIITDYKNKASGGSIPEWVTLWLEDDLKELEALDAYKDRFVFISRNEGNNFNALTQWTERFSPELDFPRMAAARIEARFLSTTSTPDKEYGSFFISLIRTASDAPWDGAHKEDYFWFRRKYFLTGDGLPYGAAVPGGNVISGGNVKEPWEFLILVTIEKPLFASQLDAVFQNTKPSPPPTTEQTNAATRIKEHFFEGF